MKSEFVKTFFDFFFPRLCFTCTELLVNGETTICKKCLSEFKPVDGKFLQKEYERKFAADKYIDRFYPAFLFQTEGKLQTLLHELKYNRKFGIGFSLGRLIAEEYLIKNYSLLPDIIIPVPLHHLKKADRGYNQSYFISKGISSVLKIPVKDNIVKRIKFTGSQTKLSLTERKKNVSGIFEVKKIKAVKDKTLFVVDDVITTGSTINELARVLKYAGAEYITALSVALAEPVTSFREPTSLRA